MLPVVVTRILLFLLKRYFTNTFKTTMKKTIQTLSVLTPFIVLMSCGNAEKSTGETIADSLKTVTADTASEELSDLVMYNIPSPMETFTMLKISGASFDKTLLNPVGNISKYTTSYSKAVNLGTYSADLSFCLLYKQNQDINIYLKNVNELTSALDIDGTYVQTVTQRLKVNSNNLDSIVQIVSEATVNANLYLKENQRDNVTALITAGGWVEGMYFLASVASKTQKPEIISLVAEQKNVVKNLVKVLEQFSANDKEIAALLTDINNLATVYDSLKPVQDVAVASTEDNIASIGSNTSYELTKEQLKSVLEKVTALRNKLTN